MMNECIIYIVLSIYLRKYAIYIFMCVLACFVVVGLDGLPVGPLIICEYTYDMYDIVYTQNSWVCTRTIHPLLRVFLLRCYWWFYSPAILLFPSLPTMACKIYASQT